MAVEIEGLEFQIQSDSDKAAKGVDALADSFEKLKKSLKRLGSLTSSRGNSWGILSRRFVFLLNSSILSTSASLKFYSS